MPGAIQLMTQRTAWYQVLDRAAPVNVACHVTRPALSGDSAHQKEEILGLMSATDSFSTSSMIYHCGSTTGPSIGSWVIGPFPVSFNHKLEPRSVFSAV